MSLAHAAASRPKPDAVRVMVVDDSVVVRGLVTRWLEEEPDLTVVGSLRHGKAAVDEVGRLAPDVIVLDVEMPEMDGLTALPLLLQARPGVVIVMASTLTRRNAELSMKCLALGARDYVPKPESNSAVTTSPEFRREIVAKVKALGATARRRRAGTERIVAARPAPAAAPAPRPATAGSFALKPFSPVAPRLLAIGSSTGGPQALLDVLKSCGPIFPRIPVVITQHMPPTFTAILAEHLGRATGVEAREAKDGESITANRIYVAPGGLHLTLQKNGEATVVRLVDGPPINFCKPAVDPMFESMARIYGPALLAVVLTGMGSDGAKGAGVIAAAGGSVIAQDEASSVVWGMPGATAQAGVAAAVLPLDQIAPRIVQLVSSNR